MLPILKCIPCLLLRKLHRIFARDIHIDVSLGISHSLVVFVFPLLVGLMSLLLNGVKRRIRRS